MQPAVLRRAVATVAPARLAVTARALSTVAARTNQQQQKQRQHSKQSNARTWTWRGLAGAAALFVGGGVTAAACQSSVDYSAVRGDLEALLESPASEAYEDGSFGPVLVRLAWHSAGTYDAKTGKWGSNGGTMRFKPESEHGANAGLGLARDLLEPIKSKYPGLSYADLYTLAGAVAIESMGGPKIFWQPGRTDAKDGSACPPNGHLPDATQGCPHLRNIFNRMGFNDREIVALSGAHALGRCHTDRSGFSGPWTRAPTTFSNEYFRLLLDEKWTPKKWNGPLQYENSASGADLMMLPTDLALTQDPNMRQYVELYAKDEKAFFIDFAHAFGTLLELGVPRK